MQGQENKQQLDMNLVLKGYQKKVEELTHESIIKNAVIEQLEARIKELEHALAPAQTVEEQEQK